MSALEELNVRAKEVISSIQELIDLAINLKAKFQKFDELNKQTCSKFTDRN